MINSSFGWAAILASDQFQDGPVYPLATPGVRLQIKPTDQLTLLTAVFSGAPAGENCTMLPQQCNRYGLTFSLSGGAFWMGEAQYGINQEKDSKGLPGIYKLGWYATKSSPHRGCVRRHPPQHDQVLIVTLLGPALVEGTDCRSHHVIHEWSGLAALRHDGVLGDEPLRFRYHHHHLPIGTKHDCGLAQRRDDMGRPPGIGPIRIAGRKQQPLVVHPHENHMASVGSELWPEMRIQEPAAVEISAVIRMLRIDLAPLADRAMNAPHAGGLPQRAHPRYLAACGARTARLPGNWRRPRRAHPSTTSPMSIR
jgi:Carbohydrate-selective porin, OprB family